MPEDRQRNSSGKMEKFIKADNRSNIHECKLYLNTTFCKILHCFFKTLKHIFEHHYINKMNSELNVHILMLLLSPITYVKQNKKNSEVYSLLANKKNTAYFSTRFLCAQCGVPLHPEGCYTRYHMLKHYWRYALNFKSLSHTVFM